MFVVVFVSLLLGWLPLADVSFVIVSMIGCSVVVFPCDRMVAVAVAIVAVAVAVVLTTTYLYLRARSVHHSLRAHRLVSLVNIPQLRGLGYYSCG